MLASPDVLRALAMAELDSLLNLHDGDTAIPGDDGDDGGIAARTVDEILNDSDSSPPSPPPDPSVTVSQSSVENSTVVLGTLDFPSSTLPWRRGSRVSAPGPSSPSISSVGLRSYSLSGSSSSSRAGGLVFSGVLAISKPGAALAAAAAASRPVPTPYSAAIKSRRAGADACGDSEASFGESASSAEASDHSQEVYPFKEDHQTTMPVPANSQIVDEQETSAVVELSSSDIVTASIEDSKPDDQLEYQDRTVEDLSLLYYDEVGSTYVQDDAFFHTQSAEDTDEVVMEEQISQSDALEDANFIGEPSSKVGDSIVDDTHRSEQNLDRKLLVSRKPLEMAEEMEKRKASSGMHLEEGAAAQPMRLEGIRSGPPAIGYLQVDIDNAITRTMSSHVFRRDHGSPQVVALHFSFIAIGMSKGTIIVMPSKYSPHSPDNMDAKVLTFGFHGEKSQTSVTSMCFNQQGDLLLAGYGDGHVAVWDTQRAVAAKVIFGEHAAPIVHTLFLGQDSQITRQFRAVTGDAKGLVLLHTISVAILLSRFSIKTQCLLDGQKTGTVWSASPVLPDDFVGVGLPHESNSIGPTGGLTSMVGGVVGGVVGGEAGWKLFNEGSSLAEEGVVVFATHQNALVVRLSPTVEIYKTFEKPDGVREGSMPYTAWKCTHGSSLDRSGKISWLVIAWDRRVQVAKLLKSEMTDCKGWNLDSSAIGVEWLDDQMLVILTVRGQLVLFAKDGSELHRTSFVVDGLGMDDIITYHTHFSNNFGNPERAYHNSIAVRGASIYILGPTHLIVSRLLPWKERIQALQKAGDWMGALDLSMRLYDGFAHGVIDLPRNPDAIREAVMPYLVELILSYVDEVFSYISLAFCSQNVKGDQVDAEIEEQYLRVGGVAVEFCVHIKRTDILFDAIYTKFVSVQHAGTFLEILEPYILKDMLGCLPPEIMHALVEHYNVKGWLQRVEQCVLHMDISSLDFNQVIKLCRKHGLYGALIYLFNRGLNDYRAPLEEFLLVVQNGRVVNTTSVGYRMLVYLKYCFLGLAFPPGHGNLLPSRSQSVKLELLNFLLEDSKLADSHASRIFVSTCGFCPNVLYLLLFDTEATLQVLRLAFLAESGTSHPSTIPDVERKGSHFDDLNVLRNVAQSFVNTLVSVLNLDTDLLRSFKMDDDIKVWPSDNELGELIQYIVFLVACSQANISVRVLKHIVENLTKQSDPILEPGTCRKEKYVLALLRAVPETYWNSSYMLQIFTNAQFHQACGFIHQIRGEYVAALDSFMKDFNQPVHSFVFINKVLSMLNDKEVSSFHATVVSRIPELVKLNRTCTYFLVIDHFNSESQQILSKLHSYPQSLFLFLKTAIEVHLSGTIKFPDLDADVQNSIFGRRDSWDELEGYVERLSGFQKHLQHNSIHVTDEIAELYLELLCQFERNSVLKFLESFQTYRLEKCLQLCQKYEVTDAAAFLLERVGDVGSALVLLMTEIDKKFDLLFAAVGKLFLDANPYNTKYKEMLYDVLKMNEVVAVHEVLHSSMGLCQRNTRRLDPQESELLWFRLLDTFSEPLKRLYNAKEGYDGLNHVIKASSASHKEQNTFRYGSVRSSQYTRILQRVFSQFVGEIIEEMSRFVPLPAVMAKLLSDNGGQEFGDFKLTILRILGSYGYERRILDTAKSLIEDDMYYTMSLLKKGATHAYAPRDFTCCLCGSSLTEGPTQSSMDIRVFGCGHAAHLQCSGSGEDGEASSRAAIAWCPICLPKKNLGAPPTTDGLVWTVASKSRATAQGSSQLRHFHEPDTMVDKHGIRDMARFEILGSLQKAKKSILLDSVPQLRLAPPAVYQEKVARFKNPTASTGDSGHGSLKTERSYKQRSAAKDPKLKGSLTRLPLKPILFGADRTRAS